ncbi:hypothetical protein ACME85_11730 [Klebsiella pneumoniae]
MEPSSFPVGRTKAELAGCSGVSGTSKTNLDNIVLVNGVAAGRIFYPEK